MIHVAESLETLQQTARRFSAQELFSRLTFGHRIDRQPTLAELQHETAALGDFDRILDRLGQIGESLDHLLGRAQILLARVVARSRGIGEQRALVDAHPRLVRLEIITREKAHIVGGDDGQRRIDRKRDGRGHQRLLFVTTGTGHFEVVTIWEQRLPELEQGSRLGRLSLLQGSPNIALASARERNQTFR